MSITRSGEQVSPQIGKMGCITELNVKSFHLPDGQAFHIKNKRAGTLSKSGRMLAGLLDAIEKGHCEKSIIETKK